jgi:hypothetical protein
VDYKTVTLMICLPIIGFFLVREFKQKDSVVSALQQLTLVVGELKHSIENVKLWVDSRFTRKTDHDKDIEDLRAEISRRFEERVEDCPARQEFMRKDQVGH